MDNIFKKNGLGKRLAKKSAAKDRQTDKNVSPVAKTTTQESKRGSEYVKSVCKPIQKTILSGDLFQLSFKRLKLNYQILLGS